MVGEESSCKSKVCKALEKVKAAWLSFSRGGEFVGDGQSSRSSFNTFCEADKAMVIILNFELYFPESINKIWFFFLIRYLDKILIYIPDLPISYFKPQITMPATALPMSFRSKGGSKYPPRNHDNTTFANANTTNLQIPGFTKLKMDITPQTIMINTNSVAGFGFGSATDRSMALSLTSSRLSQKRVNKLTATLNRENTKSQLSKQRSIVTQQYEMKHARSSDKATHGAQIFAIKVSRKRNESRAIFSTEY